MTETSQIRKRKPRFPRKPKRYRQIEGGGEDALKELSAHQLLKLWKNVVKDPSAARSLISNLKNRGYETDLVEPLFMAKSTWDRTIRGAAEGISFNVIPGDMGEYRKDRPENLTMTLPEVDLPLVGKVGGKIDPWFEGGKLAGSMIGQQKLFQIGSRYLAKPTTRLFRGLIKDKAPGWSATSALGPALSQQKIPLLGSKSNVRRLLGRTGGFMGRNVPEGVIGGVAQAIREEDFDAALPAALEWYAIGLTGDVVSTKLIKALRNAKRRKERGEPLNHDETQYAERIADEVEVQISRDKRASGHEDFGLTPERGFDPESGYTGKVLVPAEESWILSPNGEPLKIGQKLEKYPGVLTNEKDALEYHASIPHRGTHELGDFLPLSSDDVLGSTRLGLARGDFYQGLDLLEKTDIPKDIPMEAYEGLRGPTLLHGTGLGEKLAIVQPDGSLKLKPSENFQSEQQGFSTTTDIRSAVDYAERIKGSGPDAKRPGVVFEIEQDAFPVERMVKEASGETFFEGLKEINIPAGKWIERWKTPLRPSLKELEELSDEKLFERHVKSLKGLRHSDELSTDAEEIDAIAAEVIKRNTGLEFSGKWNSWIESPPKGVDPHEAVRVTPLSITPQGPPSLPKGERFFMHLGGTGEGKAEARDVYRATIVGVLREIENKSSTPDIAMQKIHGELKRLQQDPDLSEYLTVPGEELYGLHIENFHYELLKAVHNRVVTADEAIATVQRAMYHRESPKPILRDLRKKNHDAAIETGEDIFDYVEEVSPRETSAIIKNHPFFREGPEGDQPVVGEGAGGRAFLSGGDAEATLVQKGELSGLIQHLLNKKVSLDVKKYLPSRLSVTEAAETIRNLKEVKFLQANRDHNKNIELFNEISESGRRQSIDESEKIRPELDPPALYKIALDEGEDVFKPAGLVYRKTGLGRPSGSYSGGRNPIVKRTVLNTQNYLMEGQVQKNEWHDMFDENVLVPLGILTKAPDKTGRLLSEGPAGFLVRDAYRNVHKIGVTYRSFRERLTSSFTGKPTEKDIAVEKLFLLSRGLDDPLEEPSYIYNDPNLTEIYKWLRNKFLPYIADRLDLPQGLRMSEYFMHVHTGQIGRFSAIRAGKALQSVPGAEKQFYDQIFGATTADTKEGLQRKVANSLDEKPVPEAEYFRHLLPRTKDQPGYEFDLRTAMSTYINSASDYITFSKIAKDGMQSLAALPEGSTKTSTGELLQTNPKKQLTDYLLHVFGAKSDTRAWVVDAFKNADKYNRAVDSVVGFIGGGKEGAKLLRRARTGDEEDVKAATLFVENLIENNRKLDVETGKRKPTKQLLGFRRQRAKTALKLNSMLDALQDPNLSGPVASQIYRIQMHAKLAWNAGFGLANLSQYILNTYPLLGREDSISGLVNYLFKQSSNRKIYGHKVADILKESGVLDDVARQSEFFEFAGKSGISEAIIDIGMKPGKWSENTLRGSSILGAYEKFRREGMLHTQATYEARALSNDANFAFNRAGTPPILRKPLARLLLMFKSYSINQFDFTTELIGNTVKGVKKKGLLDAALEGDMTPLTRHMMMYLVATGSAGKLMSDIHPELFELGEDVWEFIAPDFVQYVFKETNLPDRMGHPAQGLYQDAFVNFRTQEPSMGNIRRRGVPGVLGSHASGPLIDTMESFITESVIDGLQDFIVPGSFSRLYKEGTPGSVEDALSITGLKAYKPKKKLTNRQIQNLIKDLR